MFMALPFLKSLTLFLVCNGITGFVLPYKGIINNVWIMEMFGKNGKTYLQSIHILFPVGQMLGPLIYVPFAKHNNSTRNGTDEHNNIKDNSTVIGTEDEQSELWIPFWIVGLFLLSVSVLVLVSYLIKVCVLHKIFFSFIITTILFYMFSLTENRWKSMSQQKVSKNY